MLDLLTPALMLVAAASGSPPANECGSRCGADRDPPVRVRVIEIDQTRVPDALIAPDLAFDSATRQVTETIQTVSNRIEVYRADDNLLWSDVDAYERFFNDAETYTRSCTARRSD